MITRLIVLIIFTDHSITLYHDYYKLFLYNKKILKYWFTKQKAYIHTLLDQGIDNKHELR